MVLIEVGYPLTYLSPFQNMNAHQLPWQHEGLTALRADDV